MRGRNVYRQPPPGSIVDTQHELGHGCVGWWEMNMGSGLVVPDISGQNNHGTMTNMDAATDWVQGENGGEWAVNYDNDGGYISAASVSLPMVPSTIRLRYISDTNPSGSVWFDHQGGQRLAFYNQDANTMTAFDGANRICGAYTPIIGAITEVVLAISDNGVTGYNGYANGSLIGTASANAITGDSWSTNWFWASEFDGTSAMDGRVISAAIYNRALDAEEIAHLYAEPYAPIWQPGERSFWYFSGGGGVPWPVLMSGQVRSL